MQKKEWEKYLLERYLQNPEFVIRIRGSESLQVKVYYQGVKYFDYEKDEFKLNKAVFIPNNKNRKNLKIEEIPKEVKKDVEDIKKLNFEFTIGTEFEDTQNKSISLPCKVRGKDTNAMKKKLEIEWKEYYQNLKIEKGNKEYFFCIGENNHIEFEKLYSLMLKGYEKCPSIKFYVELKNTTILKKNKKELEEFLNELDVIMKRRIDRYCGENQEKMDDYILTREDSEKAYQQKLMEIMYNKDKRIKLDEVIFKNKKAIPFEMEYSMSSKEKKKRIKGRIDNLIVRDNTLIMLELKMGTRVIGGTNGIHKHLIDLCHIFENNKKILEQVSKHIHERERMIEKYEIDTKYRITGEGKIALQEKEYYIICGYHEAKGITKEEVKKELDRIYTKTIKEVEILKIPTNYERSKLTEESKTVKKFHQKLEKNYHENLLNMTIPQYREKLDKQYNCKVEIYLVNEDYTKFEKYS